MKANMTTLQEASALEAATDKCFARYEKRRDALLARTHAAEELASRKRTEAHNAKMEKLTAEFYAERDRIAEDYSEEAVTLYHRLQSEKAKAEGKAP